MASGGWIDAFLTWLGPDAVKATLAPSVTILLFMFSNLFQWLADWRERKRATKRVVIGVYAEITLNLEYTRKISAAENDKLAIQAKLTEDFDRSVTKGIGVTYRPLIGITDSTKFYDANLTALIDIDPKCVKPISLYYRSVADQYLAMQAIKSDAFLTASLDSRLSTIDVLWQAFHESCARGDKALASLGGAYPHAWFG